MEEFLTAAQVEARINQAGFRVADLCRRSGVSRPTFARWKQGKEITMWNYQRLVQALETLEKALKA